MDCHEPSVLAMTKGDESSEFFFFFVFILTICGCGLLRRFTPRNDSTPTSSLRGFEKAVAILIWRLPYPTKTRHCEGRRPVAILFILGLSLRGFEKAVAILGWDTMVVSFGMGSGDFTPQKKINFAN